MTVDTPWVRDAIVAVLVGAASGAAGTLIADSLAVGALIFVITALMVVTVPTDSGLRYSLSLAAVAAAPLLLIDERGDMRSIEVLTVIVVGTFGAHAFLAFVRGLSRSSIEVFVRNLIDAAAFIIVFVLAMRSSFDNPAFTGVGAQTFSITLASAAWFFSDVLLWAASSTRRTNQRFGRQMSIGLDSWPVAASVLATGVFFGIAWQFTEWWWALPVALMPYGFAHVAFHRAHETRATYRQTIRALSRIPEVSALSPDGHGDRTAELALNIAGEIGMSPRRMRELEYAAQMHDIGRITLNQPSILRMGFTDEDIARWGAEMVAEVEYLSEVAELVMKQHEPYRRPGEQKDLGLPLGAKIIKAASAYDHATTELGFMPVEALEVLHRGAAYDYDPDVVAAIRSVLEREQVVS